MLPLLREQINYNERKPEVGHVVVDACVRGFVVGVLRYIYNRSTLNVLVALFSPSGCMRDWVYEGLLNSEFLISDILISAALFHGSQTVIE